MICPSGTIGEKLVVYSNGLMACARVFSRNEEESESSKTKKKKKKKAETRGTALRKLLTFYLAKMLETANVPPMTLIKV